MTEFCNKIKIIPAGDVSYIIRNEVVLKPHKSFETITTDSFFIEVKPDNQDAGCIWSVDQTIITDKVSDIIMLRYSITRSVIVVLEKTDGDSVVLGSPDYPVQLTLVLGLQTDQLIISLKTTDRPIL